MTDRRERIPAAEITDPKRWNLPYWTTPPHVIQAEREEQARALAKEKAEQALAEIGDQEIEIEVQPYTAEQLENIRQQAYNEGLEQGLIEGRQKGETLGHEAGYQEGLTQGVAAGKLSGEEQGRIAIEKKLTQVQVQQAQEHAQQVSAILKGMQNFLIKQSQNIEKVLPELVEKLARAVVGEELNQGSEHIVSLVQFAMDALPLSSEHLQIELNEADVPYLESAFEMADFSAKIFVNKQISAGGCKIKTQHSHINFTLDERWTRIIQQYHDQLSLASLNDGDDDITDPSQELLEPVVDAFSAQTVSQVLEETAQAEPASVENDLDADADADADSEITDIENPDFENTDFNDANIERSESHTDQEPPQPEAQFNTQTTAVHNEQVMEAPDVMDSHDLADSPTAMDSLIEDDNFDAAVETQPTQSTTDDHLSEQPDNESPLNAQTDDELEQPLHANADTESDAMHMAEDNHSATHVPHASEDEPEVLSASAADDSLSDDANREPKLQESQLSKDTAEEPSDDDH